VLLRDGDVLDGRFDGEEIGENLAAGEGGKGQGADELFGGRGHHGLHMMILLHQKAGQFGGFIRRDAAADREKDLHRDLTDRAPTKNALASGPEVKYRGVLRGSRAILTSPRHSSWR
jgi:hypothetical protein